MLCKPFFHITRAQQRAFISGSAFGLAWHFWVRQALGRFTYEHFMGGSWAVSLRRAFLYYYLAKQQHGAFEFNVWFMTGM
jgi:hypothetical protein